MKKLIILSLLLGFSIKTQVCSFSKNPIEKISELTISNKFTPENLYKYIIFKKIKHPNIVYSQAILETGNFTSIIFKENNNLFGMRAAKKRITTSIGSNHKHASYLNWKHSVDDYLLWQNMFIETPIILEKDYLRLLGKVYATDSKYVEILKKIKTQKL